MKNSGYRGRIKGIFISLQVCPACTRVSAESVAYTSDLAADTSSRQWICKVQDRLHPFLIRIFLGREGRGDKVALRLPDASL
jgi:hypothetical protein